jgi:hypothetical protein
MVTSAKNKQIIGVRIDHKEKVYLRVRETIIIAPKEGDDGGSKERKVTYPVESELKPHRDFLDALLQCRKFALDLAEFEKEDKTKFIVEGFKIKGDMSLQNSRVEFVLVKHVKRTGKGIKFPTGEVTMYGNDYHDSTKMTKAIEKVQEEALKYMRGKNDEEIQLSISFEQEEELEEA